MLPFRLVPDLRQDKSLGESSISGFQNRRRGNGSTPDAGSPRINSSGYRLEAATGSAAALHVDLAQPSAYSASTASSTPCRRSRIVRTFGKSRFLSHHATKIVATVLPNRL